MEKYVLDGQVYVQRKTGIYRYCNEILKELDKIISPGEIELVVPSQAVLETEFKNIEVVRYGRGNGVLWAQTYLPIYCLRKHVIPVSFYNTTPILRPGIAVIHDVGYKAFSKGYSNLYGKLSSIWHRFNYWYISRKNYPIITVSEFSKNEICNYYGVNPNRIKVIGNAWQHYRNIIPDESVFEKDENLIPCKYFFCLGSLEERKNLRWIIEVAKRNPKEVFVMVGGTVKNTSLARALNNINNIKALGRLEDEKVKALLIKAKAFVFPSIYEGFGIPPLEALCVGTKVLCSNYSCLPEILEEAVIYFDPYDYDVDLNELNSYKPKESAEHVLEKYSWEKSAKKLYYLLFQEDIWKK